MKGRHLEEAVRKLLLFCPRKMSCVSWELSVWSQLFKGVRSAIVKLLVSILCECHQSSFGREGAALPLGRLTHMGSLQWVCACGWSAPQGHLQCVVCAEWAVFHGLPPSWLARADESSAAEV